MGWLSSVNLRSKLIAALLAAGALTGLTQAWLGNQNVKSGFEERLDTRLKAIAAMTNSELELHFRTISGTMQALGSDIMISDAIDGFVNGQRTADRDQFTPEKEQKLKEFYNKSFIDRLAQMVGTRPVIESYLPDTPQLQLLQHQYMANNPAQVGEKHMFVSANDGSAYDAAHTKFHPALRALRDGFGFADLFLISPNGDVIYSVAKEVDFQTSLVYGAFNDSGLARAFRQAREQRSTRPVVIEDFSFYEPSLGAPNAFIATPVFSGKEFKGIVAVQLSGVRINEIVTRNKGWRAIGLGDTGDIYVVGADGRYRTTARPFEENREAFLANSAKTGTERSIVAQMGAFNTPIKLQSTESALDARTGNIEDSTIRKNALGQMVRSYALPLSIPGLDWVTVTEMSLAEATRQTVEFQKLMMIALAISTAITTVGAMFLSGLLARPIKALTNRLNRVADGDLQSPIGLARSDEIGELSRSAQTVVDGFRYRMAEEEQQRESTTALLNRFLPDGIVRLIKAREGKATEGDDKLDNISEAVSNATFILGKLSGYEAMFEALSPEQVVQSLDQLVQAVDLAADKYGVEKVRTAGDTYFAVCGLSTPHLDHRQRGLSFARDLHLIVENFRHDSGGNLQVKISIASGSAISGVIGREKLAFDIWGKPVTEGELLNSIASPGEIRVTKEFAESLKDVARFKSSADPSRQGMLLDFDESELKPAAPQKKSKA